jgi:PEP-CTERM motif
MRRLLLGLAAVVLFAGSSRATVVWNESVNGDLSNSQSAPTPITLSAGTNSIIGSVVSSTSQTGDPDWVALTVPAGFQLNSDVLAAYTSTDNQGFTGFQAGSSFVGNPETTPSAYAGYAHFGSAATNPITPTNLVGQDLLPLMANPSVAAGATGFTIPLGAGTYTFLFQQTGASLTSYQFDFGVTAVPEPGSLCLLGLGGLTMLRRKSR